MGGHLSLGSIPVLCVIQARWNSTRLPGKMLLKLGSETLIERAWRIANECATELYEWVSVVAIPKADESGPLGDELRRIGAKVYAWDGPEWDVLGRFYHCAHHYRWHPDTVIVRHTPDDPFKDPAALRRTAQGFRMAPEIGGEAFTLAQLNTADLRYADVHLWTYMREHITDALFPFRWPPYSVPGYTIDTIEDLEAARAILERQERKAA